LCERERERVRERERDRERESERERVGKDDELNRRKKKISRNRDWHAEQDCLNPIWIPKLPLSFLEQDWNIPAFRFTGNNLSSRSVCGLFLYIMNKVVEQNNKLSWPPRLHDHFFSGILPDFEVQLFDL
jgi:hypothetical protein